LKRLSLRQISILDFISVFVEDHGYPPTLRDIQQACDISSTSVVDYNLNILQNEGHIRRSPDVSRGIQVGHGSKKLSDITTVPLLGYIAAGQPLPILSTEDWTERDPLETIDLDKSLLKGEKNVYALRVSGTSMIDALIDDGDVVIIKPSSSVRNGDMVVAWLKVEKEATLKRFYHEGAKIRLEPANRQMKPIIVSTKDVEIQGTVLAVLRSI
jgi:repressor LexA